MAKKLDEFVKNFLNDRFEEVLKTLTLYRGAIENMVSALYETETIEGAKVREIIKAYEQENNLPSRLVDENDEANADIAEAKREA